MPPGRTPSWGSTTTAAGIAAIVTDTDWLRHLAGAFGWMVPGALEVPLAERADAIAWVAADD
ncbi:MAG: STAS/SEC14 domain-containing protein [Acidimicrobiales bacterium]